MEAENKPVYLDYNATTPLDPRVLEAMMPWLLEPANAGSRTHIYGQRAKSAVDAVREQVATLLDAQPEEVIFTSGATESNNLAILGLAEYGENTNRKHIISTTIEHKAVLEPLQQMQKLGFEVELAPVNSGGFVEPDEIRKRIRKDTLLVTVMHANNETGIIQPIPAIHELLADSDILFHTDAAQTFGKEVKELQSTHCDLISISSHKIYGPQGIGALGVRRRPGVKRPLSPVLFGGGQERGLRPGTLPVCLIVGLGKAAELALAEHEQRLDSAAKLKEELLSGLQSVEHRINGDQSRAQSHVVNVCFPGVDSEALMMALKDEIAISNGSACTSTNYTPSHVLKAMGISDEKSECSVRISWGSAVESLSASAICKSVGQLKN